MHAITAACSSSNRPVVVSRADVPNWSRALLEPRKRGYRPLDVEQLCRLSSCLRRCRTQPAPHFVLRLMCARTQPPACREDGLVAARMCTTPEG